MQALTGLRRALALDPDKCCAKLIEDSDFDPIRHEPTFQELLNEFCPS